MKVIVVGCGRTGSGLAQKLNSSGHNVTIIDEDPTTFETLGPSFKGQTIVGLGFDREVLLKAKIERTDALAAVTRSDEINAVVARIASQVFRVPRVVARLFDVQKAEIYNRLGLQTFDPTSWGINRVSELLSFSLFETIASVGYGGVDIVRVEIPALLVGRRISELVIPGEIHVVAISRNNKTFLPTMGTVLQKGDYVQLAVAAASTDRLRALLGMV
ncbi:MAG: potassium channel family protein [Christensenellales bacterium]